MQKTGTSITRRALLKNAALPTAGAVLLAQTGWAQKPRGTHPGSAQSLLHLPVLSQPDLAFAFAGNFETGRFNFALAGSEWTGSRRAAGVLLDFLPGAEQWKISLESPALPVQRIHLRWKGRFPADVLVLGDA